jgi:hypothetical protein
MPITCLQSAPYTHCYNNLYHAVASDSSPSRASDCDALKPCRQNRITTTETPNTNWVGPSTGMLNCATNSPVVAYLETCPLACSMNDEPSKASSRGRTNENQAWAMQSKQSTPSIDSVNSQHPPSSRRRKFWILGVKSTLKKPGHNSGRLSLSSPSQSDLADISSTNPLNTTFASEIRTYTTVNIIATTQSSVVGITDCPR